MKNNIADLDLARTILTKPCQQFLKDNNQSFWANHSLMGSSSVKATQALMKDLKSSTSINQLVRKVGEYKSDGQLAQRLRELIVSEVYRTPPKELEKLGQEIARATLIAASRGYSAGIDFNPAPNIGEAIDKFFANYLEASKLTHEPSQVELH